MSDYSLDIFSFNICFPSIDRLNDRFHHCSTLDELRSGMKTHNRSTMDLVVAHHQLLEILPLIDTFVIQRIYVMTNGEGVFYPTEFLETNIQLMEMKNEIHLKYSLLSEGIVYYHSKAVQHPKEGDNSLANRCASDALHLWESLQQM